MTRVLVATNEPILAKGLEDVLTAGGFDVIGRCSDVFELFECFSSKRPDIVVLDLPMLPTPEVIRDLRRCAPKCQFVLWSRLGAGHNVEVTKKAIQESVRYGARAVPPNTSPEQFVQTVSLIAEFFQPEPKPADLVKMACSSMEREFITLAGYGLSNDEIAAATRSDGPAVGKLLKTLAHRLGAGDRYELALYGLAALSETGENTYGQT
jgi:DNA-binding NarL/FixJ family response regulator